jgi:hypothetical protein
LRQSTHFPRKVGRDDAALLAADIIRHLRLARWQIVKLPPSPTID